MTPDWPECTGQRSERAAAPDANGRTDSDEVHSVLEGRAVAPRPGLDDQARLLNKCTRDDAERAPDDRTDDRALLDVMGSRLRDENARDD